MKILIIGGNGQLGKTLLSLAPLKIGNTNIEIKLPQEKQNFLEETIKTIKDKDLAQTLEMLGKAIMKK